MKQKPDGKPFKSKLEDYGTPSKPKLASTPVEVGYCEHGVRYAYRWLWRPWLGETEENSEPEYISQPDCAKCYPEEED